MNVAEGTTAQVVCFHSTSKCLSLYVSLQELNVLHPKAGFRLWLTAEVHPRFPPILLQSSLKITYEVHTQSKFQTLT